MDHSHNHEPGHKPMAVDEHTGHSAVMFRNKFWISLALTIPVLVFSPTIQSLLRFSISEFIGSDWIGPILGTVIFFYGGVIFIKSAWREIKQKKPGMMTLIALAIIAAYAYSLATTFLITGPEFFWELSTLITTMLFGNWIEMRAVNQTKGALAELSLR